MCGIAGFVSKSSSKEDLLSMTSSLAHRGPDEEGYYYDKLNGIGLGHKRLSIMDLSKSANQPMTSHCGRFIMVYNGEVYNYKEVAKNLNIINWKTSSDTEVILEAFVKWGLNFTNKLNGMFAIAIYDKSNNEIFLFRDRIGIKPLYYFHNSSNFFFTSELKAFNGIDIKKEINYEGVYAYLHLGYIPYNKTIFNKILKLDPGSFLRYKNNNITVKKYWNIEDKVKNNVSSNFKSNKLKLNQLLRESVEKRLISDVPIGTFLSGGTDSSIVTAVAQEVSNSPINTFSIGFKEAKYNESEHAKKVANHLGTNHYEFILTQEDAFSELENIMEHFDEPFADTSALPTMLVSKMAKKHVTVCLSGDGGDELFMGYGAYNWAKRFSNPLLWSSRKIISLLLSKSSKNYFKRAGLVFNSPKVNWKSHIFSQEQCLFSEKELNYLLLKANSSMINTINETPCLNRKLSKKENQAFFDINNYLKDDLLVKVDRSTMYCSLEARVPLLDHNIIEFALNINENLKIKNGYQKYLLKELSYNYIPKKIMNRAKWGFSIPLDQWLKTELYYLIEKYLTKSAIEQTNFLNYQYINEIILRFNKGENYLYNRLWSLINLQKFMLNHS